MSVVTISSVSSDFLECQTEISAIQKFREPKRFIIPSSEDKPTSGEKKINAHHFSLNRKKARPMPVSQLAGHSLAKKLITQSSTGIPDKEDIAKAVDELIRSSAENLTKLYEVIHTQVTPMISQNSFAAQLLDTVLLDQLDALRERVSKEPVFDAQRQLKRQVSELMQFDRPGMVREKGRAILIRLKQLKQHKPIMVPFQKLVDLFKHSDQFPVDLEKDVVITKEGLKIMAQKKLDNPVASYTDRKLVGGGSFGRVYETLKNTDRVALKVMDDIDYGKSKIIREAVIGLYLEGPLVIAPHKVMITDNAYMVMDLAEGSLETLIARSDFSQLSDLLSLMRDLVNALVMLKSNGVCHGDIKPSNLVLVRDPTDRLHAKLIDFGNSSFVLDPSSHAQDIINAASVFHFLREVFKGAVPKNVAIHLDEWERLAKEAAAPDILHLILKKAEDASVSSFPSMSL